MLSEVTSPLAASIHRASSTSDGRRRGAGDQVGLEAGAPGGQDFENFSPRSFQIGDALRSRVQQPIQGLAQGYGDARRAGQGSGSRAGAVA